jgi:type II secretory pathway pseudopilin PulG
MNNIAIITGLAALALGYFAGAWHRRDEAREAQESLGVEKARREQAERERDRAVQLEASTRKAAFALLGEKWREREREVKWPEFIECE